jgi:hypothetical protein
MLLETGLSTSAGEWAVMPFDEFLVSGFGLAFALRNSPAPEVRTGGARVCALGWAKL